MISVERLFAIFGAMVISLWLLGVIGVGDFVLMFSWLDTITCTKGN